MKFHLWAFTLMSMSATGLLAQADSLLNILPEIVIQENRISLPFAEQSRTIQVITREQLQALPAVSIAEALRFAAGLDVRQRGVNGVQADLSMRGGTFEQTLVLINGVKLSDPQTGHHLLNLPVDIQNVERIEILKGPAARIYGQNAFAGAINIITRAPEDRFTSISLQGGQHQLGGIKIGASMPAGKLRQYFSFSKDFSAGYRHNTDYDLNNFFYQAQLPAGHNKSLHLLAGLTERRFGANGFYATPAAQDQFEAVQTSLLSLEYRITGDKWLVKPRLYWRRNQDEYVFVRSNPSIYRNFHLGHTAGAEVNASHYNRLGMTGLGAELQYTGLHSNNLGRRQRQTLSLFAEHRFSWWDGRLDLTPGLSFNYFSDFGAHWFPGIDAGFRLADGLKAYTNAGYTYRIPSFTDRFYSDRANEGNPGLQPESALSFEVGLQWHAPRFQLQTAWFRRNGQDLIDWVKNADTLRWKPININELIMQGWDLNLQWMPDPGNRLVYLERLDIGYTYILAGTFNNEFTFSRYAFDHLRHHLVSGITWRIGKHIQHQINGRFFDRVNLEDYWLADTRLSWLGPKWRVFAEITNALNTEYTETNLVPMPGRWWRLGLESTFR